MILAKAFVLWALMPHAAAQMGMDPMEGMGGMGGFGSGRRSRDKEAVQVKADVKVGLSLRLLVI